MRMADPGPTDDELMAAYAAFMAEHAVEEAEPEISTSPTWGWDHCGRWTVKPVRGGVPDAPVAQCKHFPQCPKGQPCNSPPVDVAAFQAKTIGLKMRGSAPPAKTMERGSLRSMHGSEGSLPRPARPILEPRDPTTTLDELPQFEALPPLSTTYVGHTTSAKLAPPVDSHKLCQLEQSKLHTRTVRAEHKLARALARIAALEAENATLKARTATKRTKRTK
jgi:hypothetical protein